MGQDWNDSLESQVVSYIYLIFSITKVITQLLSKLLNRLDILERSSFS